MYGYGKWEIRARLDELRVQYQWLDHPAVTSMEECQPIGEQLGARVAKNLLLTNRQQTRFYLYVTSAEKPFRTADVSKALGVARLSFAAPEHLRTLLGVESGSASPLALYNDVGTRVQLVIDSELLNWRRVAVHPADHTSTLALDTQVLLELCVSELRHVPEYVTVPARTGVQ